MLSLTSATSGYSATSTSSFKVRTQIKCPLLSDASMVITPASLLWAHTFVFMPHRRVTVCWRSWQRWRRFETFCAGRWTRCRNTLTAALTPWPKTSSRETGVSRRCVWERWGYPIYFWQTCLDNAEPYSACSDVQIALARSGCVSCYSTRVCWFTRMINCLFCSSLSSLAALCTTVCVKSQYVRGPIWAPPTTGQWVHTDCVCVCFLCSVVEDDEDDFPTTRSNGEFLHNNNGSKEKREFDWFLHEQVFHARWILSDSARGDSTGTPLTLWAVCPLHLLQWTSHLSLK